MHDAVKAIMRITKLRQADLNLLVIFAALAEERHVSRAAARLLLSQPAVSRALLRLREMFQDHLLVRSRSGYEPTPKGRRLLRELEVMLPSLDRLLSDESFDPAKEETLFRLAGTDFAARITGPYLVRAFAATNGKSSFTFGPWTESVYEDLDKGRLDLLVHADDGHTPSHFRSDILFEDDLVCVVSSESEYPQRLTLNQYIRASHVGVSTMNGCQTIPERRLSELGLKRRCTAWLPYFVAAMRSVAGTNLLATVPRLIADHEGSLHGTRIIDAPKAFGRFKYIVTWHPRMNSDAAHSWLRATLQRIGNSIKTTR